MNKWWMVGGGIFLLVSLLAGFFIWKKSAPKNIFTDTISPHVETSTTSVKLIHWDDEAGFSIDYPEDLRLNKHDEDQENYAHLEFTHPSHPGKLIVWAKDPPASLAAWVQNESRFAGANSLDTTLGGQAAKKILINSPAQLVIGSMYDGLLFTIETTLEDNTYWSKVHDTIASNFIFKQTSSTKAHSAATTDTDAGSGTIDEEEVVE